MTIQEYSTLMGYKELCSIEEYSTANLIYMTAGDMDKQTFCREYKRIGKDNALLLTLTNEAIRDRRTRTRLEEQMLNCAHASLRTAEALRRGGLKKRADDVDKIAVRLICRKECIRWKLDRGFALSEADREYIKENIR